MKAYSQDLRERVAAACAEPGAKICQVAIRFAVSLSFTNKLLRRQRTTGTVTALLPHWGRLPAWMLPATNACLAACVSSRMRPWLKRPRPCWQPVAPC